MIDSLRYTIFTPRVSKVGKIQPFRTKNRVLVLDNSITLEALSEKKLHLQKLVMIFEVVEYKIVDIIRFDKNTVRSNVKELCKI